MATEKKGKATIGAHGKMMTIVLPQPWTLDIAAATSVAKACGYRPELAKTLTFAEGNKTNVYFLGPISQLTGQEAAILAAVKPVEHVWKTKDEVKQEEVAVNPRSAASKGTKKKAAKTVVISKGERFVLG